MPCTFQLAGRSAPARRVVVDVHAVEDDVVAGPHAAALHDRVGVGAGEATAFGREVPQREHGDVVGLEHTFAGARLAQHRRAGPRTLDGDGLGTGQVESQSASPASLAAHRSSTDAGPEGDGDRIGGGATATTWERSEPAAPSTVSVTARVVAPAGGLAPRTGSAAATSTTRRARRSAPASASW